MKKLTQAESDAAVESVNDAGDAFLKALARVEEYIGHPFNVARNDLNSALAHARIRIRALTEKETEN